MSMSVGFSSQANLEKKGPEFYKELCERMMTGLQKQVAENGDEFIIADPLGLTISPKLTQPQILKQGANNLINKVTNFFKR
jgi:hypothetical protein